MRALALSLGLCCLAGSVLAGDEIDFRRATTSGGGGGGGDTLPLVDTRTFVKGSGDATKLIRFEVDGLTTGTTRVLTIANANYTLHGLNLAGTWSALQKFPDDMIQVVGSADVTKIAVFEVDGITTGTTRTITIPNANTNLAVYTQTITYAGPTAARTVTLPDTNTTVPIATQVLTFAGPTAARTITFNDSSYTVPGLSLANVFSSTNTFVDGNLTVLGSSDSSKVVRLEVDGLTTATTRVITAPDSDTTLPIASQVLTFTGPSAPRTITLPDAAFTVAGLGTTNAFTGANSFVDGNATILGSSDATKKIRWEVDGLTTATTRVITPPDADTTLPVYPVVVTYTGLTAPRTITYPDAAFTVAGLGVAQTFSAANVFTPGIVTFGTAQDAANAIMLNETTNCITFEGTAADANEGRLCGSNGGIDSQTAMVYLAATQTMAVLEGTQTFTGLKTFNTINFLRTITAGGTTGAQTINQPAGTVNFAAAATTIVVTNSLATANSIVHAVRRTNDATCLLASVESAAGSFTIRMTAACTAETSVGFLVTN